MPAPLHFTSIGSFREWFVGNSKANAVFFIDFNLDRKDETGLDLIQRLGLQTQSFLLTGAVFDRKFLAQANESGVRIIDKGANDQIVFHTVDGSMREPDLVLIDDSRANRLVWEIEAKKEGKLVDAFGSGDEFLEECASYSPCVHCDWISCEQHQCALRSGWCRR